MTDDLRPITEDVVLAEELIPGATRVVLQRMRQRKEIAFYKRGRTVFYTRADINAYLRSLRVAPCHESHATSTDAISSSETSGFDLSAASTTVTGESLELEESAAQALARRFSTTPSRNLLRPSFGRSKGQPSQPSGSGSRS